MLSLSQLQLFGKVNHQVPWTFYIKVSQCNIKADKEQNISDNGVQIQLHKFRAGTAWTERSQNLKFALFILISRHLHFGEFFFCFSLLFLVTQYWGFCSGFSPGHRFPLEIWLVFHKHFISSIRSNNSCLIVITEILIFSMLTQRLIIQQRVTILKAYPYI